MSGAGAAAGEAAFLRRLEETLAASLPAPGSSHPRLREAMAHTLLGGGKRLRPRLLAAAACLGDADDEAVLLAGAALELLHAYSLIHDDLPAMDDDDLRRGRPTCHRVYGEALAILAGDALQAAAFGALAAALAKAALTGEGAVAALAEFAAAAGAERLVGGQAADVDPVAEGSQAERLRWIQERKTGALFQLALGLGARLGGLPDAARRNLEAAGLELGLAFQTVDDLLDARATREELGKTPGKDRAQGKLTVVSLHGEEAAAAKAEAHLERALALVPDTAAAAPLRDLALRLVRRRS